jgi:hypothetical protein
MFVAGTEKILVLRIFLPQSRQRAATLINRTSAYPFSSNIFCANTESLDESSSSQNVLKHLSWGMNVVSWNGLTSDSNFEEKVLSKQHIFDCNDATKDDKLVLHRLAPLEEFDQFASKYLSLTFGPVDVKEKREAL